MLIGNPLPVQYSDGSLALLYPARAIHHRKILTYLGLLSVRWNPEIGLVSDIINNDWQIVEAIASLIPSPTHFPFRLDPLKEDLALFKRLFLEPGDIRTLHEVESLPRRTRKPDDPITLSDIPFPTCGDSECDTIANLFNSWQKQGVWLLENLDSNSLNKVLWVNNELSRDPDERLKEYLKTRLDDWKEKNQSTVEAAMYDDD